MEALTDFALATPDMMTDPFKYYAKMRDEQPVHFDPSVNAWLVTKYDDLMQAVRMTDELSNELGWDNLREEWQDEIDAMMTREGFGPHLSRNNFKVDPPVHTGRRKLVEMAFSAQRVAAMEGGITTIIRELMDKFIDRGEADIVPELTIPTAIYVISDLLNVPRERRHDVLRWSDAALGPIGMGITKEEGYAFARTMMECHHYLNSEIERRRKDPSDDMISLLSNIRNEDDTDYALPLHVLLSICVAMIAAGNETTRNSMSFGIRILAENPQLLKAIHEAEDQNNLLLRFVEEVLRFEPTVPQLPRHALKDCVIGNQQIKAGDNLLLCWASGNYDPAKFPEADRFILERKNAGQHLTFGAGIYRCVGAPLARMEMKCMFREIVRRMATLELAIPASEIPLHGTLVFRGPMSVPVRFTKRV